jgi:hypothetical protein
MKISFFNQNTGTGMKRITGGIKMSQENSKDLKDVVKGQQSQQHKQQSLKDQERLPDQQNRLKDQENMRK